MSIPPFHIAFPVHDIQAARDFYGGVLGCPEGRSAASWVDFNLYGHQIVGHLVRGYNAAASHNAVDGDPVPVPHFGVALSEEQFHALAEKLKVRHSGWQLASEVLAATADEDEDEDEDDDGDDGDDGDEYVYVV
ncbi:hypothetical protein Vretimale_5160 [Volvox reticuliferus]|uniref:Uncharacterized protein n=1 Tax=Volvox reticuliferus TaxID=1737510 RepID=A0A8J4FG35_9CHLO|nr:hypothetical protein Vretifemale_3722 [Volvox reticuliferus]GIM00386.1 hypothetical protein Vretimale_5160 [Volvox reticuliferus]